MPLRLLLNQSISIHSTTRVETLEGVSIGIYFFDFNPLHHEGGDGNVQERTVLEVDISIHSTTRVET